MSGAQTGSGSGERKQEPFQRRCVDYSSTAVRYLQARMWQRDVRDRPAIQPTPLAAIDMLPTVAYPDNPATSFSTRFVHCSVNKVPCPINKVLWTPSGRRLITGSRSGEITLWNGRSFNFESILQGHDNAIRSMIWSHNENWMITGDDGGCIKFWQPNFNNVKKITSAHQEAVQDLSFSSTDLKFCSCSDDKTVKVWDFVKCREERTLTGHGWDVKSVDWHPQNSLLASGARDSLVKLWDARSGRELCTLDGHKSTVESVKWNNNGNWLLTASTDQIIRLYDIRSLKPLESYQGHRNKVTALAWHPFHEELFVSGCLDGSIIHWLVGGSDDKTTKFWCRSRPGDANLVKRTTAHLQGATGELLGTQDSGSLQTEGASIPGLGIVRGAMSTLQLTEAGGSASNSLAVVQSHGRHPPSSPVNRSTPPHPPSSTVNWRTPPYQQHSSRFGQQDQQNRLQRMPQTQHPPGFCLPGQRHLALPQSQLRLIPQQSHRGPPPAFSPQSPLSRPGHPSIGIGVQNRPIRPMRAPTAPIGMPLAASIPGSNVSVAAGNARLFASQLGIGGRLFRSNIDQGRNAALAPLVSYGASIAPLLSDQLVPVLPPFQAEANAANNLDAADEQAADEQVLGMAINNPQHHQDGPGRHL